MMRQLQVDAVGEAPIAGGAAITGQSHRRGLVVATLAALLMAFVGAFDTAQVPILPRLAFWLIVMESGALIGIGASTGVRNWGRLADRRTMEAALVSLLIALPLTLVTSGATALFFGTRSVGMTGAVAMFVGVFVVTAAITAINYALGRTAVAAVAMTMPSGASPISPAASPDESATGSSGPAAACAAARLIDRLPPHLRVSTIIALEAEDHYVRVHTAGGSDLVLLRLTDAMAELDGLAGARTHRSWWVARGAVRSATRGEGRGELVLANGMSAPVSRSAMPVLQREGWFAKSVT